jgi:competence protein ComEA
MTQTNPRALAIATALTLLVAAPAMAQTRAPAAHAHATTHPAVHATHAATHATPPRPDDPTGVVNIQTATAEQLQLLPGIGPSKAEAIVRYRSSHPFARVEDILRVRGIGRVTFRRLRPMITVSGATTMTADVHAPHGAATPEAEAPAPRTE